MNDAAKLHRAVWELRAEIGHVWLTPSPLDCLRYAFTEAGEAMDAWLRQQRPDDARNNARDADVLDELADCAIMLVSALGPNVLFCIGEPGIDPDLDKVATRIAATLLCPALEILPGFVGRALRQIFSYPGFTLDIALARLEKIRAGVERWLAPVSG